MQREVTEQGGSWSIGEIDVEHGEVDGERVEVLQAEEVASAVESTVSSNALSSPYAHERPKADDLHLCWTDLTGVIAMFQNERVQFPSLYISAPNMPLFANYVQNRFVICYAESGEDPIWDDLTTKCSIQRCMLLFQPCSAGLTYFCAEDIAPMLYLKVHNTEFYGVNLSLFGPKIEFGYRFM